MSALLRTNLRVDAIPHQARRSSGYYSGVNFQPRTSRAYRYNPPVSSGGVTNASSSSGATPKQTTEAGGATSSESNGPSSAGTGTTPPSGGTETSSQKDLRTGLNNSSGQNTKTTWWLLGTTIGLGACSLIVRFTNLLTDFVGDGIVKTWTELGLYAGTTLSAALTTSSALALGNDPSDTKNLV
jgi:hypothetical protein